MSDLEDFKSIRESTGGSAGFLLASAENFPCLGFQNANWKLYTLTRQKVEKRNIFYSSAPVQI